MTVLAPLRPVTSPLAIRTTVLPTGRIHSRERKKVKHTGPKSGHSHGKVVKLLRHPSSMIQSAGFEAGLMLDPKSSSVARSIFRSMYPGNQEFRLPVFYSVDLASTAGAVINANIADSTGMAASAGWGQLSVFFDEVRLDSVSISIHPRNKYSKTVVLSNAILMLYDDDSVGTLVSYQNSYGSQWHSNTDDLFPHTVTAQKPRDPVYLNDWQTTASLATTGGFMFYANTLSASTTYGTAFVKYNCSFRQAG